MCKFLEHVAKLADETKTKDSDDPNTMENTAPPSGFRRGAKSAMQANTSRPNPTPKTKKNKRGAKRKAADISDDEILMDFLPKRAATAVQTADSTDEDSLLETTVLSKRQSTASSITTVVGAITNHDRLIALCMDVVDHYMQVASEDCRLNAVFFIHQFLPHVKNLDEEICNALRITLPQRIRDRKPIVRAHAVYASRTFQESKLTKDAFIHHFYRDPELVVRKALLQIMDTKIFGYQFLVESTQDTHETMRKDAFRRLGKLSPLELNKVQLHQVLHNGLSEHERLASYFFRNNTLDPWLSALYDGTDLYRLLLCFDTLNHHQDICRLLKLIFERDLEKLENNGTTTKLHMVVEAFRERWLQSNKNCLPTLEKVDINLVTIWLKLIEYCKKNRTLIRSIKVREVETNANDSIEKILDSQSREDDLVELYERLTPDLVNMVDFAQKYVVHTDKILKSTSCDPDEFELIYNLLMEFICSYEIGDELERKTIQDVLGSLIRENLLTGKFNNFIPPIIKCLASLIYSNNHGLLIDYVSEIINNVRSHLEDILTSTRTTVANADQTVIHLPTSQKKNLMAPDLDCDNLEIKIADLRVKIEEFKDQLDIHIKEKDFDRAKEADIMINKLKDELALLHSRRCSIASDISHMSMVVEKEPTDQGKLCSTMLEGDVSMNDSDLSSDDKDDTKVFKHHPNELIKCLQMYYGCLQNVSISAIPLTMLNHLNHLSYECLDDWYRDNHRVRSLMVACNGLTALVDREYAEQPTTMALLVSACHDRDLQTKTTGFKSVVDVLCRHDDIKFEQDKVVGFLKMTLRDYGKMNPFEMKKSEFEFQTAVIEGTTKLFYHRILSSPEVLSHLILWWYHPRTHSKLKQFIGIFLPAFVEDIRKTVDPDSTDDIAWLKDLLEATFVISIEYLHTYILGPGHAIMSATDLLSLINFLSNLIPASFHQAIAERLDERIDEVKDRNPDLAKYLKQSKNSLTPVIKSVASTPRPVLTPLPPKNQAQNPTLDGSPVLDRSSIMNE